MSVVNGFQVGSDTLKYNYESLENYNTPEFSASSTYAVGDYVMHEGKLYRCTTAITTAAAWNSSKWTAAVLTDDVRDNSADCDGLVDHLVEVTDTEPTSDYNKVWIPETLPTGVQVPTYSEFTALEDRVDDIEEGVASVETSTTASKAYAVGDYFWKDDVLYVVTAAIASGGTITVNTNCKAAVLGNDVSSLKSAFTSVIDGTQVNYLEHVPLIYGSYASGNTIGTPTGGGGQTRAVIDFVIPFSDMTGKSFVFYSNSACNVAFNGFDGTGATAKCNSTPSVWLSDGTYSLDQIKTNARATSETVGFTFAIKMANGSNIPTTYADTYSTIGKYLTIAPTNIRNDSISEAKLTSEVREKLNGVAPNTVDVILFMGQSNMAGRGEVENAPSLIDGAGYEYRAISAPNTLSPMVEPFGATESNPSGIDEGSAKTGSMVVAFTNAYYTHNGHVPVIGVSASKGGTKISEWQPNGAYLTDAINRLDSCVAYLNNNSYTIRHKYVLFCLGETDGDDGTTADTFKTLFDTMLDELLDNGIEKAFLVRIGNKNYQQSTAYDVIMNCQTEIAQTEKDVVMASTDFAGMRARNLMKDMWHYYQEGYNEVGTFSGINVAIYEQTGKEPTMYDTKDGTLYYSHKN